MRTRHAVVLDSKGKFRMDTLACNQKCDACSVRFICFTTRGLLKVTKKDNPDIMHWFYTGRQESCELVNEIYKAYEDKHKPYGD